MRVLAALGAIVFLYLAIIPAGLIYSTVESACAGEGCETSLLSKLGFTAMYAACLAAVLGTAALFAAHAVRGRIETQERLSRGLSLSAVVIGLSVFVLFTIGYPLGGGIALTAAAIGGGLVLRQRNRDAGRVPDPATNGHGSLNGHAG